MKLRDMPRELAVVTFAMIVANITSNMYAPYEPLYLESLGAGVRQVGFFFTAQTIMSIAFRVLGGWISDNLGRLPTIALGSVFGLLAYLGYTLAPTWAWAMFGALMGAAAARSSPRASRRTRQSPRRKVQDCQHPGWSRDCSSPARSSGRCSAASSWRITASR